MGNQGDLAVSTGYANLAGRSFGKAGLEYTHKGDLKNPNLGYSLAAKANALIGDYWGVNTGASAAIEFNKGERMQRSLGLEVDYSQSFKANEYDIYHYMDGSKTIQTKQNNIKSLKMGLSHGISAPTNQSGTSRIKAELLAGVDLSSPLKTEVKNSGVGESSLVSIKHSNKMDRVTPFVGLKGEFSHKINSAGNEIFINAKGLASGASYAEAGLGFRF